MQEITKTNFLAFITCVGDKMQTSSRFVAEAFGKLHKNVLRAHDKLECSPEFKRLNYEPVEFIDKNGDVRREVLMTKDGFMFLVMGFTGKEAARMKEAFITAFNAMAEALTQTAVGLWKELHATERALDAEDAKASYHGRGLCRSKYTRPPLRRKAAELQNRIQLPLLFS